MTEDERELVRRCAAGDAGAWRQIVGRYTRLVWTVARRGGLSPEDAEDLCQEVFAAAHRALPTMREPDRFDAWLVTTARRQAGKARHRLARQTERESEPHLRPMDTADSTEAEPAALHDEALLMARRAMAELSERCQRLLYHLFSPLAATSYEMIANTLGLPVGSLGPTRQRCLSQLAAILAKARGEKNPS